MYKAKQFETDFTENGYRKRSTHVHVKFSASVEDNFNFVSIRICEWMCI